MSGLLIGPIMMIYIFVSYLIAKGIVKFFKMGGSLISKGSWDFNEKNFYQYYPNIKEHVSDFVEIDAKPENMPVLKERVLIRVYLNTDKFKFNIIKKPKARFIQKFTKITSTNYFLFKTKMNKLIILDNRKNKILAENPRRYFDGPNFMNWIRRNVFLLFGSPTQVSMFTGSVSFSKKKLDKELFKGFL